MGALTAPTSTFLDILPGGLGSSLALSLSFSLGLVLHLGVASGLGLSSRFAFDSGCCLLLLHFFLYRSRSGCCQDGINFRFKNVLSVLELRESGFNVLVLGLGFHLASGFHEEHLERLAFVLNGGAMHVCKVFNLSHFSHGLSLVLIENGDVVFEVVAESISQLDRVSNGLQSFEAGPLFL